MSSEIAQLGLAIDSSQATTATAALDKFAVAGQTAANGVDKLAAAVASVRDPLLNYNKLVFNAETNSYDFAKANDKSSESTSKAAGASEKGAAASSKAADALAKHGKAASDGGKELGKFAEIASVLESRMLKLGNSLGLVGEVMSIIGPGGLAAAAGVGAVLVVIDQLVTSANRMGEFAQQLQNLSATSGVSTTALQALQSEAVGFGLSAAQTGAFLERFTQQMEGVRKGSGSLYTELLKIDPALASQLSVAKNTTDALNLLAQAYTKAGASQNALASAAGAGRGTAGSVGLLLGDIAQKGGVNGLTSSVNQLDLITQKQVETWSKLKREIDDASTNARNNIASIYSGSILEAEKTFYDKFLDLSREMKQFSLSEDYKKFIDGLTKDMGPGKTTIIGYLYSLPGKVMGAVSNRVASVNNNRLANDPNSLTPTFAPPPAAAIDESAGLNTGPRNGSLGDQSARAAVQLSFLGSAATATDRYDAAVAKLNLDVSLNKNLTDLQGRALAGLSLDKATSEQNSYVSALGALATTQDKVTAASLNFQKAQLTNSRLTNQQRDGVKLLVAANDEWSRANQQAAIGVFDLGAATRATGDLLKSWVAQGLLDPKNPEQYAAAVQVAASKVTALSDAAKVAGSQLPQFTQFMLDAGNVNKQMDIFATTSANAITPALRDMFNGTTTLSAGFKSLGLTIVQALEDAIIKIMIVKPLIDGLSSSLRGSGILDFLSPSGALNANGSITGALGPTSVGGAPLVVASGGLISGPGTGTSDSIPARLSNGEFVVNASATAQNLDFLHSINRPQGFAAGGPVGNVTRLPGGRQDNTPPVVMNDNRVINIGQGASQETVAQLKDAFAQDRAARFAETVAIVKRAKQGRNL